jgi:hypothetical protein
MSYVSERKQLGDRPEKIELENRVFSFVTGQRGNKSAIYKSQDSYLRIGEEKKINSDLNFHRKMESSGFPIAKLLSDGVLNGQKYYIESSLGEKHFGNLFADDIEHTGTISEPLFNSFLSIIEKFAGAQLSTYVQEKDFDGFARGIWLNVLCEEMPTHVESLRQRFKEAQDRFNILPFVLTHGDFNPNNLYPVGVIDLEDSFYAPYGYDLYSALIHIDSFPDSRGYEYIAKYRFTSEQHKQYVDAIDAISVRNNLPKLSTFLGDFAFCRAVWLAAGIPSTPKLQQFRYESLIRNFLS